jgi:hypothetical protein
MLRIIHRIRFNPAAMKRYTLVLASAMLVFAACSVKEEAPETPEAPAGYKVLSIQASSTSTKTSYAGDVTFSWSAGDQISVLCNDGTNNFWQTFTVDTPSASSTFTATVADNVNIGPAYLAADSPRLAMYPACDNHVYENSWTVKYTIPAERDFRSPDGHKESAIPMIAWGKDDNTFAFANLTGAAKFTFSNVSASHVKFVFTGPGVKMNGTYSLFWDGGINLDDASNVRWNAAVAGSDEEKVLTFYADVENGEVSFYVPYATGEIWAGSKIRLEDADNGTLLYEHNSLKAINITKNRIAVLPTIYVSSGTPGTPVNVNETFTESALNIANPERGMYVMVEYKYHKRTYNDKDATQDELTTNSITSATYEIDDSYDANNRLTMTLFYLHDFVNSDHISSDGIEYVRSVLTNVRIKGKKAIVRFAYNNRHPSKWDQEPTLSQIQNHLQDLTATLSDFEDIIYVVQAGFIGTYGEWYYTTHFGPSSGGVDYTLSNSGTSVSGYENRRAVIDALLAAVPNTRQIALRTPEYKACYFRNSNLSAYEQLSGFGTDAVHRLAFHNDAFLYGNGGSSSYAGDMGTFSYDWHKNMWKDQGAYLINGGEAPYSSKSITGMDGYYKDNVQAAIFDYHYSYLHHDTAYHTGSSSGSSLMKHWHEQGWMDDIVKWLGYRLYLANVTVTGSDSSSGSTLNVSFTLENSGAAPVINVRPMQLVLLHGSTPIVLKADCGDVRLVPPGTVSGSVITPGSKTYSFTVTLPQSISSGDRLALWLPDNAEDLQSRAVYSIRLANNETTWTSDGYNVFYTF